ncbi:MAG TPA: hypothetical protein PLX41_10105 [Bacteroidales bacterium]|nr:hypothetical protein [Bacteroidales bacterium]
MTKIRSEIILVVFALFVACGHNSKSSNTVLGERNKIIKDSIPKEKDALNRNAENRSIRFVKDIPFYSELISTLNDKKDTVYICSRWLLEKFNTVENQNTFAKFTYDQYEVILKSQIFNEFTHSIDLVDTILRSNGKVDHLKVKNIIDGHKAHGIDGNIPRTELSEFVIKIDQDVVEVPKKYFNDIFNANLENTEVYLDTDRSLIFVYINGSDAAGGYSVKYVINRTGYITRIITDLCGFDFIDGINYDCV